MTIERWQLEHAAAERYEGCLVPRLMAPWAPRTVAAAGIRPGEHVLDVACGTGVVARAAAACVGPDGLVVGLDLNAGMLAVARRLRPDLEWRQGDAADLPFPDASFDRVVCQFGLMFFPDRVAALREMRRVLRPGGAVAVATWGAIEASPPYAIQAEIVASVAGPEAAAIVAAPFAVPDPAELGRLLEAAGFGQVAVETIQGTITYASADAFLEGEIDATPLGDCLRACGPTAGECVRSELRAALGRWCAPDGGVTFPVAAHLATGEVC